MNKQDKIQWIDVTNRIWEVFDGYRAWENCYWKTERGKGQPYKGGVTNVWKLIGYLFAYTNPVKFESQTTEM